MPSAFADEEDDVLSNILNAIKKYERLIGKRVKRIELTAVHIESKPDGSAPRVLREVEAVFE